MARVAKVDTIERSKLSLNKCMVQSNNTVSVVTNAIESLQTINSSIDAEIAKVEEYESQLAEIKNGLVATKTQNETVVKNFNSLIVEYISQFVDLEEKNGEYWGLSPFSDEKTPSFSVRRENNTFLNSSMY